MNHNLLDQVYSILEYDKGDLVSILSSDMRADDTLDIGEWLSSCHKINKKSKNFSIDSVFFLKDNPAVIFGVCYSAVQKEFERAYINVWKMRSLHLQRYYSVPKSRQRIILCPIGLLR